MAVILRQSLNYAVDKGYIDRNPFKDVEINTNLFQKTIKPANETQVFFKYELPQLVDLLESYVSINTDCMAAYGLLFMLHTGIRIGEVQALRLCDIDGNYAHIHRQEVGEFIFDGPDTMKFIKFKIVENTKSRDFRRVYITEKARKYLDQIVEVQRRDRLNWRNKDGYLLFENGEKIKRTQMEFLIRTICERIDTYQKSPCKLRKTYISLLIDSGVNISDVMNQVGHQDKQTTYNNYCYSVNTDKQAEEQIEKCISAI